MEKAREAYEMRKKTMGFIEILEDIGVFDEVEARVEASKAIEVAKNLIHRIGLPLEQVADATGLDLETVQSLADGSRDL
jgi:adenylate cyclase class IV